MTNTHNVVIACVKLEVSKTELEMMHGTSSAWTIVISRPQIMNDRDRYCSKVCCVDFVLSHSYPTKNRFSCFCTFSGQIAVFLDKKS